MLILCRPTALQLPVYNVNSEPQSVKSSQFLSHFTGLDIQQDIQKIDNFLLRVFICQQLAFPAPSSDVLSSLAYGQH